MRLVIDCFKLIKGTGKSIGIYNVAQGLVKHLGEINMASGEHEEIIVLGNDNNREDFDVPGVMFKEINQFDPTNKLHIVIWELLNVSTVCKKLKADRVLFPRGFSALTHPVYDIVLIHDLIPFYYNDHFPGYFNRLENAYIMSRLKQSARNAKKVITISQASKQDIIRYCEVDEQKISVIHNACEELNCTAEEDENRKQYICAMTSTLPHKNAKGVIESYRKYCELSEEPLDLVIIGLKDTNDYDLPDSIRQKITCHKFIKNTEDMYKIIGKSEVFLFLSLVEGFGLPPIEAMQLGVPVICSNTSSLPEVAGDAAVLVNPDNSNETAKAINELTQNEKKKEELVRKGFLNTERFSWAICANSYWNSLIEAEV